MRSASATLLFSFYLVMLTGAGRGEASSRKTRRCPVAAPDKADIPGSLAPPADARMFLGLHAEGTQIYSCKASDKGGYAWALKAPAASLYDDRCTKVGTHFAGPTWKIDSDGSAVVGAKVAEAPSPGSIPMLLVKGTPSTRTGKLGEVSYIQRVATTGGLPPAAPCDASTAGKEVGTPYTATYLFYRSTNRSTAESSRAGSKVSR